MSRVLVSCCSLLFLCYSYKYIRVRVISWLLFGLIIYEVYFIGMYVHIYAPSGIMEFLGFRAHTYDIFKCFCFSLSLFPLRIWYLVRRHFIILSAAYLDTSIHFLWFSFSVSHSY